MQLDTDKNGLPAIFKAWQVPLIEELFKRNPMISRQAHIFLKERDIVTGGTGSKVSVSRASVINFLNYLVDQELLNYTMETGKGGYHRIYTMTLTREAFNHRIIDLFLDTLRTAFPTEMRLSPG